MNTEKAKAPNVVLLTVDALRYDHLGCYGYHRDTSPNIDDLATKGTLFLKAISNGGQTQAAFPAILASILPPMQQYEHKLRLQRSTMLAELLREAGYRTAAFHSNPYLSRFYGYERGFDMFDDSFGRFSSRKVRAGIRALPKSPHSLMAKAVNKSIHIFKPILSRLAPQLIVSAEEITKKALSWLGGGEGKFFLWIHYMDVHGPYMPTRKYLNQFSARSISRQGMKTLYRKMLKEPGQLSPSERETLINLYDADIKYTDAAIGVLLDKLEDYLDDTIVVFTADHGDEFGEHAKFAHQTVYDGVLRVPLIIAGPGIKRETPVKQQVSLVDLAPTIADLAGIDAAPSFQGRTLMPVIEGKEETPRSAISIRISPTSVNISYRLPGWKYIRTESLNDRSLVSEEVYDLANDPGETKNLHGADREEVRRFEQETLAKLSRFKQLKAKDKTDYEKQRIRAKLRKLDKL